VANHASAKKRIRQTAKRTFRNRAVRTNVRTLVKRVREAIAGGDQGQAQEALKHAVRRIDMAVSKGVYHRKTGSRYIARLTQQVNALAAA
jgi:small subunit ribosomal protein S20